MTITIPDWLITLAMWGGGIIVLFFAAVGAWILWNLRDFKLFP